MPLIQTNELLRHATKNRYGVAAINVFNYESILWAVKAAERIGLPLIIQFYPGFSDHIPAKYVAYIAKDLAAKSPVCIAVHLDHSSTAEIATGGIRDGFPSIMIDCSTLPFDENAAITAQVVKTAAVFGVDVEAELDHVGSGSSVDDITNTARYTSAEDAAKFATLTGCGSLAIAVGNAHGAYIQKPSLDFDRIKAIRAAVDIPLVLHGCSGIPDSQMQDAVKLGISKYNIATEYDRAYFELSKKLYTGETKQKSGFITIRNMEEDMMQFVIDKMFLLNPDKKTI